MPRFICSPGYDSFTYRFPVTLKEVKLGGATTTQNVTLRKVKITDKPTRVTEAQAEVLRESDHYGTWFYEMEEPDAAPAPAKKKARRKKKAQPKTTGASPAGEDTDAAPADGENAEEPADQEPNADAATVEDAATVYADVTDKAVAAGVLVADYNVDEKDLQSSANNITKKLVSQYAAKVGVSFPNL
ncbi:MAG: hypothetical protein Rubg2KO_15500 [Rubricoccaceae bacterium]